MLKITNTKINLGLKEPVKILHLTDAHFTFSNDSDTIENKERMFKRTQTFYEEGQNPQFTPYEYFEMAIKYAKDNDMLIVNTGDILDLPTYGNIEKFKQVINGNDMMFTPGGHEFQKRFVRTMEEEYPHFLTARETFLKNFPMYNIDFSSRVVGGVNIICADNSLDYYSPITLKLFKEQLKLNIPIIVFSHDPIWDEMLKHDKPYHKNVRLTTEDYKASHELIDIILNHPLVITSIGGHNHVNLERVIGDKTHYSTAGLFKGICRCIEIC